MLRWENSFRVDNGKVNPCSRYCLTQPWRFRKALIDPSNLHHVSHRRKTMISTSPGWGSGNRFFRSQGQTRIAEGPISETLDEGVESGAHELAPRYTVSSSPVVLPNIS